MGTEKIFCLACEKEIEQPKRGRAKNYCNDSCRSNYWQKEQRKMAKQFREMQEVKVTDLTKPTNVVKSFEQPKTNFTINTIPEPEEKQHPKFQKGDPREGSNGFYLKYGVFTYDEI